MKFVAKVDIFKWMTNDQLFCCRPQAKICYDTICNESCKFCENFSPPQISYIWFTLFVIVSVKYQHQYAQKTKTIN